MMKHVIRGLLQQNTEYCTGSVAENTNLYKNLIHSTTMMPHASSYPPYNTPTPAPAPSSEGEQQQVVYVPVLVPANRSSAASSAALVAAATAREQQAARSRSLPPPHASAALGREAQSHMLPSAPDQFEVASILAGISRNPDQEEELAAAQGGLRNDSKQQGHRPDLMLSDQKARLAHTLDSLNLQNLAQLRRLEEEERARARLAMLQGGSVLYPSAHSLLMGAPISEQALFARSLNPSIYQSLLTSQGALDPLSARVVQALSRENPAFSTTRELAAAKAAATARSQQYPEDSTRPPRSFDNDAYCEEFAQFQRDVPKISTKGGVKAPFPVNLWNMLHHIENFEPQLARVISWQPDGLCFRVHDKKRFEESAQARFFGSQVNYTSFRRQLNLWGFKRINDRSINHGAYFHPKFQRHGKYLCRTMVRPQKSKTESGKNAEE